MKLSYKKLIGNYAGFTLIEVLVALAIIAIALVAIVKATSYDLEDVSRLEQKAIANMIAVNAINAIQLHMANPSATNVQIKMLNHAFYWSANETPTPDPNVNKMIVTVYLKQNGSRIDEVQGFYLKK